MSHGVSTRFSMMFGLMSVALVALLITTWATVSLAQAPKEAENPANPTGKLPPWQRVLKGDDAMKVAALEKQIWDLEKKGQFAEAVGPAQQALAIRHRVQGEDHWETVNARLAKLTCVRSAALSRKAQSDLATSYMHAETGENLRQKGRNGEAEPLLVDALAVVEQVLGEDYPYTATACNNLALNHGARGRFADAAALSQRAIKIRLRVLGQDHPNTAGSYQNAAAILMMEGKCAEAGPLIRKALGISLRVLGEDHEFTTECYNSLAGSFMKQGKYAEADPLFRKALAINLRDFVANDSADTARLCNNLALNLRAQGKYVEADPLFLKALAINQQALGELHYFTSITYSNRALNFSDQGKYAEAEPMFRKALAIQLRILGEEHTSTARSHNNLGLDLNAQHKYAEAEAMLQKALAIRRHVLGEDHPDTANSYASLAKCFFDQNKYADADPPFRTAIEIDQRVLGENHAQTAVFYTGLAHDLNVRGQYAESEAMAVAAAKSFEAARLGVSFSGVDRAQFAAKGSPLPLLAALQARRRQGRNAWQRWEAGLARGLFDDLAARRGRPLTGDERSRQEDLLGQINRLNNQLAATVGPRANPESLRIRLDGLNSQRLDLQRQLSELDAELVKKYPVAAGMVYTLDRIQAQIPPSAALVGWLDLENRPKAADPRGDHWACVVRRTGAPLWVRVVGTGPNQSWTKADDDRPGQVQKSLSEGSSSDWQATLAELAEQRLGLLEATLQARGDQPPVKHLIILPSPALAGIPIEPLLEARSKRSPDYFVSYAPSGTMFAWIQERRQEDRNKLAQPRSLLALGDPIPPLADQPSGPTPKPPDHGLLVRVVQPDSNAANAGIQPGDVLLSYAGSKLATGDDLQKHLQATDPKSAGIAVTVWRDGKTLDLMHKPGPLGASLDTEPAAEVILAQREGDALLRRTRGSAFTRLPGTRREVQAVAGLFDRNDVLLGSDASEQRLDDLRSHDKLKEFAVIHLATHGKMDDLVPMNSRLLLSQDHLPDPSAASLDQPFYDGTVTAGEVMSTWKLNAELVTLSACQSGLGRSSGGEGYVGFAQALFLAGARRLPGATSLTLLTVNVESSWRPSRASTRGLRRGRGRRIERASRWTKNRDRNMERISSHYGR
jgi:tetratricopeptide (TPR) repeat protein